MENEDLIELPYAGFFSRVFAFILDWLLVSFVFSLFLAIIMPAGFAIEGPEIMKYDEQYVRDMTEAIGPWLYVFFLVWVLYNAFMHAGRWQATLGKRALGIIVTDLEGERPGIGKTLLREIVKLLSLLIFIFILLLAAFTSRRQALHDMVGGTVVLKYRIPREEE